MKAQILCLIAAVSGLLGEIPGANAATVYVTTNGVGILPYDAWTNAAPSIQLAIDQANPGDLVLVGPGTYRGQGNRDIDFRGKAITVRGDQGAVHTRLDVGGSVKNPHRAFRFSHGESTRSVIEGFTMTGGYGPKDSISLDGKNSFHVGGAIYCITSSPSILNCTFTNNYATYGAAIQLWKESHAQVANCRFVDNRTERVGSVLHVYNYCRASISNCIFARNQGHSLKVDMASDASVIGCLFCANLDVPAAVHVGNSSLSLVNCTIADNPCSTGAVSIWHSEAPIVRNCILWNNTTNTATGSEIAGTTNASVFHACVGGGYPGVAVITNNPLFVARGRDYRLSSASPCINAGTNQPWMIGAADLEGHPRIIDGIVDMGAYEYGASAGAVTLASDFVLAAEEKPGDGLTAQQILDKMVSAYATCKSYRDTGSVSNVSGAFYPMVTDAAGVRTVAKDPTNFVNVVSFKTAFLRPDRFRFEFQTQVPRSRFILWAKGNEVLNWWNVRPGTEKPRSLDEGISGATGISSGSAHTVPSLLLPARIGGRKLTEMTDLKRLPDETLEGVDCFKLQGKFATLKTTLWLEKETRLIRRIDTDWGGRFETQFYSPELNPDIPDQQLEFSTPDKP